MSINRCPDCRTAMLPTVDENEWVRHVAAQYRHPTEKVMDALGNLDRVAKEIAVRERRRNAWIEAAEAWGKAAERHGYDDAGEFLARARAAECRARAAEYNL